MIRLIVADDHPVVLEGLTAMLGREDGMEVVGQAADGFLLFELLAQVSADVLILDVSMPGPGFLETVKRVVALDGAPRILVLSIHAEDYAAARALRLGAAGYLTKSQSADRLAQAIRTVHAGERFVTAELAEVLLSAIPRESADPVALSNREEAVVHMLAQGMSQIEISTHLGLSRKTVFTYRHRVLQKLGLKTTADLIRYALERDLHA